MRVKKNMSIKSKSAMKIKYKAETEYVNLTHNSTKKWQFVNPPVYRGSTVLFDTHANMQEDKAEFIYGRWDTPLSNTLANTMANIEGGFGSVITCSGLSAITTAMMTFLDSNSHILISESSFHGTLRFADKILNQFGVEIETFNHRCIDKIEKKIKKNTKFIYLDLPGTFGIDIIDIENLRNKIGNTMMLVDNTWGTPFYSNPIKFGADIVIHSASKFIAGHSDSIMGVVVCKNQKHFQRIQNTSRYLGQHASPDDVYLVIRGLKTLGTRMKQHFESACQIGNWLIKNKKVSHVFYPPCSKNLSIKSTWSKLFRGGSGVLGFTFKEEHQNKYPIFLNGLRLIKLGWGWGGYESVASATKIEFGEHENCICIKISVGLESPIDLLEDLNNALSKI